MAKILNKGWGDMGVTSKWPRMTSGQLPSQFWALTSRWPLTSNDPPMTLVGPVATHGPSLVQVGSSVEEIWQWPQNDLGWPQVNYLVNFERWPPDGLWWPLTSNDTPHDTRGPSSYSWTKFGPGRVEGWGNMAVTSKWPWMTSGQLPGQFWTLTSRWALVTFDLKWPTSWDSGSSSYTWFTFGPGRVKGWGDMAVTSKWPQVNSPIKFEHWSLDDLWPQMTPLMTHGRPIAKHVPSIMKVGHMVL